MWSDPNKIPRRLEFRLNQPKLFYPEGPVARDAGAEGVTELRQLLGPLVSPLLCDETGSLDLKRLPSGEFSKFSNFLAQQVSVDGISFNRWIFASYQAVLEKKEYEPLLRRLWGEVRSQEISSLDPNLIRRFTADLISVSPSRFVQQHFNHTLGRQRLHKILEDTQSYPTGLRADLQKALAEQADGVGASLYRRNIDERMSSWNMMNIGVTEADVSASRYYAQEILKLADYHDLRRDKFQRLYKKDPGAVSLISGRGPGGRSLAAEDLVLHHEAMLRLSLSHDAKSQIGAKLESFWLMVADSRNWIHENPHAGFEIRWWLLEKTEGLLAQLKQVHSAEDLLGFNEKLQDFLQGPRPESSSQAWNWIKHQSVGQGIEDIFEGMPGTLREPFDDLRQLSERWKCSQQMGERLRWVAPVPPLIKDEADSKLLNAKLRMEQALEATKHELWFNYKQHKAASRFVSNIANLFSAGDIATIREANRQIDVMLNRLEQVKTPHALQVEIEHLYGMLDQDGALHRAFLAAELDGTEQLIGIMQSVALMAGITLATRGIGTAPAVAEALAAGNSMRNLGGLVASTRAAQAAAATVRVVESSELGAKLWQGAKLGMSLSLTENTLAVASREYRPSQDFALAWMKDGMATGIAMGAVSPLLKSTTGHFVKPLGLRLGQRYLGSGIRGVLHFAEDSGLETLEELSDQSIRRALDGDFRGVNFDQVRDIALLSSAGGGVKMGGLAEGLRSRGRRAQWAAAKAKLSESGPELIPRWNMANHAVLLGIVQTLPEDHSMPTWTYLLGSAALLGIFDFFKKRSTDSSAPGLSGASALVTRWDTQMQGVMDARLSEKQRISALDAFSAEILTLDPEDPQRLHALTQVSRLIDQLAREKDKVDWKDTSFSNILFGKNPFYVMNVAMELYDKLISALPPGHPSVYEGARYLRSLDATKTNDRISHLASQLYVRLVQNQFCQGDEQIAQEGEGLLGLIENSKLDPDSKILWAETYLLLAKKFLELSDFKRGVDLIGSMALHYKTALRHRVRAAELYSRAVTLYTRHAEEDLKIMREMSQAWQNPAFFEETRLTSLNSFVALARFLPPDHPDTLEGLQAIRRMFDDRRWMLRLGPHWVHAYGRLVERLPAEHPQRQAAPVLLLQIAERDFIQRAYTRDPVAMAEAIRQAVEKTRATLEAPQLQLPSQILDPDVFERDQAKIRVLEQDWEDYLRFYRVRVKKQSVQEALADSAVHLPWLLELLQDPGMSRLAVKEYRFKYSELMESESREKEILFSNLFLKITIVEHLEAQMGLPGHTLFWADDESVVLRELPLSFVLQTPFRIHGERALQFQGDDQVLTLEQIARQILAGQRTLYTGTEKQSIHGTEFTHPYLVAMHDVYHHLKLSAIDPQWRKEQAIFALALGEVKTKSQEELDLIASIQEKLVDGDLPASQDLRSFFSWLRFQQMDPDFYLRVYEQISITFKHHPRLTRIQAAYREETQTQID